MYKLLPGVKKISAILVAAQFLCSVASMGATSGQSMPSYAKRSMSGSDCTKPKDGRFPDQHLFARSKRLCDFIVEGKQRYWSASRSAGLQAKRDTSRSRSKTK